MRDFAFYYTLKNKARDIAAASINQRVKGNSTCLNWRGLTLSSINAEALDYAHKEWRKYYSPETHLGFVHGWKDIYWKFCQNPSHFDLAIWQDIGNESVLQGLAIGKPSRGKNYLTIHWVERSFAPTYINVGILLPILTCAETYAILLGCDKVLIKDAVDSEKYARYGYRPFERPGVPGEYLVKEMS